MKKSLSLQVRGKDVTVVSAMCFAEKKSSLYEVLNSLIKLNDITIRSL